MPTFGWNINEEWDQSDTFFQNRAVSCLDCAGPTLPWLAKQLGVTKVGTVAYTAPQSADCNTANEKSFDKFPTAKVVFSDASLPFGVPDVSAQVAEMKKKGVQFLFTCVDQNGAFTFAKEMRKQGLDIPMVLPNSYDQAFMKANGSYFEGSYVTPQFTALEQRPQPPEMETMLEQVAKTGKPVRELTVQGWIAADQLVTGLKLAGPDFNRAKLVAALNAQTDFTAQGMIAPINWSVGHVNPKDNVDDTSGLDCFNWVQVKDSTFVPAFAEGDKPWVCFTVASEQRAASGPDRPARHGEPHLRRRRLLRATGAAARARRFSAGATSGASPETKRCCPAANASGSEPMRVKRFAIVERLRACHLERGPQRAHRALHRERR